jgi:Ca2+-binding EF-hand superfamily protein
MVMGFFLAFRTDTLNEPANGATHEPVEDEPAPTPDGEAQFETAEDVLEHIAKEHPNLVLLDHSVVYTEDSSNDEDEDSKMISSKEEKESSSPQQPGPGGNPAVNDKEDSVTVSRAPYDSEESENPSTEGKKEADSSSHHQKSGSDDKLMDENEGLKESVDPSDSTSNIEEEEEVDEAEVAEFMMSVDVNKDGVLTRTEVTAWLKTKKEESLTEEVQLQWVQYDANNDGTISWVEFKEATFSSLAMEREVKSVEKDRYLAQEWRKFERADVDHNETLNFEEFRTTLYPNLYDHMLEYMVEEMLQDFDNNSDNTISLEEYIGIFASYFEEDPFNVDQMSSHLKGYFQEHDENKDGQLNKDELRDFALSSDEFQPKKQSEELVSAIDDDKDGELSHEEVMKKFQLFKNSLERTQSHPVEDTPADDIFEDGQEMAEDASTEDIFGDIDGQEITEDALTSDEGEENKMNDEEPSKWEDQQEEMNDKLKGPSKREELRDEL